MKLPLPAALVTSIHMARAEQADVMGYGIMNCADIAQHENEAQAWVNGLFTGLNSLRAIERGNQVIADPVKVWAETFRICVENTGPEMRGAEPMTLMRAGLRAWSSLLKKGGRRSTENDLSFGDDGRN